MDGSSFLRYANRLLMETRRLPGRWAQRREMIRIPASLAARRDGRPSRAAASSAEESLKRHSGPHLGVNPHNNRAKSRVSLLGVASFKYACWGIKRLLICFSLVCLCVFLFPLSGSPASPRNRLNISFRNFYITVLRVLDS